MPTSAAIKKRHTVVVDYPPEVILNDPPKATMPKSAPWQGLRVPMTREDFESRDWNSADAVRWKFEWNNGFAETYEERMKLNEIKFMGTLPRAFAACPHGKKEAAMYYELEIWLSERMMRKPDFCVLTAEQVHQADEGGHPVPKFVIEVLSPSDQVFHVQNKLGEYFAAGVKCVWHVQPNFKVVTVYTGPTDAEMKKADEICSAAPAFPKFKMKASEVFAAAKL